MRWFHWTDGSGRDGLSGFVLWEWGRCEHDTLFVSAFNEMGGEERCRAQDAFLTVSLGVDV